MVVSAPPVSSPLWDRTGSGGLGSALPVLTGSPARGRAEATADETSPRGAPARDSSPSLPVALRRLAGNHSSAQMEHFSKDPWTVLQIPIDVTASEP